MASVTATDPKEVVQEVTNAITMLTVLTEKKTMSVLAMMITLEMDSPVQVVKRQDKCHSCSEVFYPPSSGIASCVGTAGTVM